jgi:hypothetical protein
MVSEEELTKPQYPAETIYLDTFDRWWAEKEKCPMCGKDLKDLELDTIPTLTPSRDLYLMFHTICRDGCDAWIYILPAPNSERIYVTGEYALTADKLDEVYSSVVSANTAISDLSVHHHAQWHVITDFLGFFEDWKDKMQAKVSMLREYERDNTLLSVSWKYDEPLDDQVKASLIYGWESKAILQYVPEPMRQCLETKKIKKVTHDEGARLVQFHYVEGEDK